MSLLQILKNILEGANIPLPERNISEIVIYGVGNCGRRVADELKKRGGSVSAFIDLNADFIRSYSGIPCYHPESDQVAALADQGVPVVMAIFNYATDPGPIIENLRAIGFRDIVSYFEMHERLSMKDDFWLAPRARLYDRREEIIEGFELLNDSVSRQVYYDHIKLRLTFDQSLLRSPAIETQYIPSDLPPVIKPMRLVDGGAFEGDTINSFLDKGVNIEAIAAFEPDHINYAKLVLASRRYCEENIETILLPCAVGSSTEVLGFQGGHGGGSLVSDTGDFHVQVIALDEVLPNFVPTLIKLDIEGAEPHALIGASKTIKKYEPDLAVCVYHTQGHLWEIAKQIHEIIPKHVLRMRYHRFNGFDVVLYASKS